MPHPSQTIQHNTCPICSNPLHEWRQKLHDNILYHLDQCLGCGYVFVNPRPSLAFLMDYYASFGHGDGTDKNLEAILAQEKIFPNSTLDAQRMIQAIQHMMPNSPNRRFLDVGCGYGFFSAEAIKAGFAVTPLELAQHERQIAQQMTQLTPLNTSFEAFTSPDSSFDVILMSQILEHALDINLWIEKSHGLLQKNGILAIALPNYGSLFRKILQEKDPFICPPAHLNFFNSHNLSQLLQRHGFQIEKIEWVSRLPVTAFAKRLPAGLRFLAPLLKPATTITLKAIDYVKLGMILNIYARKAS